MFEQTLSPTTKTSLALLGQTKILNNSYLVGGTACALSLGHRISYDLDFFTQTKFQVNLTAQKLIALKDFKLRETAWGTILGNFKNIL